MNKVLFLGCNYNQIQYLLPLKNLGFTVIGTDMNSNAPGAAQVDSFYNVGYTNMDELKRIVELEKLTDTDHVFTASSHFAYEGASHIAEFLGIPYMSPASVDICINKTKLYPFLLENGVSIPYTTVFDNTDVDLNKDKIYYLKSDYGKSPKYCYRIENGDLPSLPQEQDLFYRKNFILQEMVDGTHYRVNIYEKQASTFLKFNDTVCVPVRVLGTGHAKVVNKLEELLNKLGLQGFLVKFDLIVNESTGKAHLLYITHCI